MTNDYLGISKNSTAPDAAVQQSMFRWRLSVAATVLFTVVFVVFTMYQCGSGSCSATYWVRYTVAFGFVERNALAVHFKDFLRHLLT